MSEPVSEVSSAQILMISLDVIEVVVASSDKLSAIEAARGVLSGLDAETAQRVATSLAIECLWSLQPRKSLWAVQEWVERVRLEATWASS